MCVLGYVSKNYYADSIWISVYICVCVCVLIHKRYTWCHVQIMVWRPMCVSHRLRVCFLDSQP